MAEELRVSRNTVAKAYSELESLGIIELVPGTGYCLKEHHRALRAGVSRVQAAEGPDVRRTMPPRLHTAMTYSLLGFVLGAVYFAVVAIVGVTLVRTQLIRGETVAVLATVLLAILFWPLRSRIQDALDHVLFRKRHELPAALSGLKVDFLSQKDLDSFLERVLKRTEALVGTRPVLVRERSDVLAIVNNFPSLRSARQPVEAGAELLMPLFSHDEVLGVLRVSGQPGREHAPED